MCTWNYFFLAAPYNVTVMGDNTYSEGEQLELSCSSEGGQELLHTWLYLGSIIDDASTSMLIIANLTTSNGGDYTCVISNNAGSDSATVTIYSEFLYTNQLLILLLDSYVNMIIIILFNFVVYSIIIYGT